MIKASGARAREAMMEPRTETDCYFFEQLRSTLRSDEEILTCAYVTPEMGGGSRIGSFVEAATKRAAFIAVTTRRLLLVETRIGAFKPLLENQGIVSIERAEVKGACVGGLLLIELADGRLLRYQNGRASKHVSTQQDFFARLESLLGRSEAAAALARKEKKQALYGLAIGGALAALYALYQILAG